MSAEFDEERMCRVNGQEPTMRDRWKAFYRLWRMSHRISHWHEMAAGDCIRILFEDWDWLRLVDSYEPPTSRVGWPVFLRKRFLEMDKNERLYNGNYHWKDRDKAVARDLRNSRGMEVTPTEVAEVRRKVLNIAKAKAAEVGLELPDDEDAILRMLKKPAE
jgi:hypothetical protein